MSEATLLLAEPKETERLNAPVECSKGHINDPYPENGQCVVCSTFLPGNPYKLDSDTAKAARAKGVGGAQVIQDSAERILEDEGIPWDEATEGMRLLAVQFAKNGNNKTLELILQQIGVLKAKPKPGEEQTELKYEVTLTAGSLESIKRSLSDLDDALRID